jgi:hypothetical protein
VIGKLRCRVRLPVTVNVYVKFSLWAMKQRTFNDLQWYSHLVELAKTTHPYFANSKMFTPSSYINVPTTDILTWTFGNSDYDHDKPVSSSSFVNIMSLLCESMSSLVTSNVWLIFLQQIYIDTQHPGRTISHKDGKAIVKKLISGLKHQGLESGDVVCVTLIDVWWLQSASYDLICKSRCSCALATYELS